MPTRAETECKGLPGLIFGLLVVLDVVGVVLVLVVCSFLAVVRPLLHSGLQHQGHLIEFLAIYCYSLVLQNHSLKAHNEYGKYPLLLKLVMLVLYTRL